VRGKAESNGGDGDIDRGGETAGPRVRQKRDVLLFTIGISPLGIFPPGMVSRRDDADGLDDTWATACSLAAILFWRSLSLSLSFCSRRMSLRSSLSFSTSLYGPTPLRRLVNTSRKGRGSNSPASTDVAVLRRLTGGGRSGLDAYIDDIS